MERKIYADQSIAFDHMNDDSRIFAEPNKSETLMMRNILTALTFDCFLILGILVITFFII